MKINGLKFVNLCIWLLLCIILPMGCKTPKTVASPVVSGSATPKQRICPDQWVINQQPKIMQKHTDDQTTIQADEYFIYQGKRLEKEQLDTEWLRRNCNLEPTFVK